MRLSLILTALAAAAATANQHSPYPFKTLSNIPTTIDNDGTHSGRYDGRLTQVLPSLDPTYINSWYYIFWLTLTNGQQWWALANIATSGTSSASTWAGMLLLKPGQNYTGQEFRSSYTFSNTSLDIQTPHMQISSPSLDNFSTMIIASKVPGATFNLTVQPMGPNFYHGGSGTWNLGTGYTYEWGNPDLRVTGSILANGEWVSVDPEKSVAWYDRQWGYGAAPLGWEIFFLQLSNGVRISSWHTRPLPPLTENNVVTIWYPSGREQVASLVNTTSPGGAYKSPFDNITYHDSWTLQITDPPASLSMHTLTQSNEMVNMNNTADLLDALWEGFVEGKGMFDGQPVTFYGNVEQYYGYAEEYHL